MESAVRSRSDGDPKEMHISKIRRRTSSARMLARELRLRNAATFRAASASAPSTLSTMEEILVSSLSQSVAMSRSVSAVYNSL